MKSPRVTVDAFTRSVSQRSALLCGWLRCHLKLWRQPGSETGDPMTAELEEFVSSAVLVIKTLSDPLSLIQNVLKADFF